MTRLLFGFAVISAFSAFAQGTGSFVSTGNTLTPRIEHTATLLKDGRVLITGGNGAANSAEIYDPSTGTFAWTGAMIRSRSGHRAVLLGDGKVLITGGYRPSGQSAELYDPSTESFSAAGSMTIPRYNHAVTLLKDGRVLISGGPSTNADRIQGVLSELYDPTEGVFTPAGGDTRSYSGTTTTLLEDGSVLVVGGLRFPLLWSLIDMFLFDPATNGFALVGPARSPFWQHSATRLGNGKVLIAGGSHFTGTDANDYGGETQRGTQFYDPSRLAPVSGNLWAEARLLHTATLLPNGSILMAGGWRWESAVTPSHDGEYPLNAELYDPGAESFRDAGAMSAARAGHTATLLDNGTVLIVGGRDDTSAELYLPPESTLRK